jgi:hypothetical protein
MPGCNKCGKDKDEQEFTPYGIKRHICKNCYNETMKKWRKNNPEKSREASRNWRKNNPEKAREATRNWKKNNPEKAREHDRNWKKNNPEKVREASRNWKKNNPEKVRETHRKCIVNKREEKIKAYLEYRRLRFYFHILEQLPLVGCTA